MALPVNNSKAGKPGTKNQANKAQGSKFIANGKNFLTIYRVYAITS